MSHEKNATREETPTEAKPEAAQASQDAKAEAKSWQDQVKKVAFAAVGAVNLSQDDVKSFVGKLVEKGEIAKKDGEKILKSFADRVQQTVKREPKAKVEEPAPAPVAAADVGAAEKAAAALNQEKLAEKINASIERVLHGMNIATRKDVEELSKQLEDLDRKFAHLVETAAAGRGARKAHVAPEHGAAS